MYMYTCIGMCVDVQVYARSYMPLPVYVYHVSVDEHVYVYV